MEYQIEKLTEQIRTIGLKTGADLVGFASAATMEKGAPRGHKPSDLMLNAKSVIILACGRQLNEDRKYVYKWGPDYSLTYIKLRDEVKQRRIEARGCIYRTTWLVWHLVIQNGRLLGRTRGFREGKFCCPPTTWSSQYSRVLSDRCYIRIWRPAKD